ncbi:MAG: hypothetical protein WCT04_13640 [Planctomycetota bacterium]
MRFAISAFVFAVIVLLSSGVCPAVASEDLLVIEQDYSIVEHTNRGFDAKDVRQTLYITRDMVTIDEFGDNGKTPTETFQIDLKNKRIINLDHTTKQILVNESFADRRAQILRHKKQIQSDLAALEPGEQKNKMLKLFRSMLDAERDYKLVEDSGTKDVAGAKCKTVKIVDAKDAAATAFTAILHPELDLPYDNSEVLFLVKVIGEKMAQFLKDNKATFSRVPMEMHLELAEGGKLDLKVISVKSMKVEALDPKARALGSPFEIPEGYTLVRKYTPKNTEPVKDKAD